MRISTTVALSAIYIGNQVDACKELKTLWDSLEENDTEAEEVPYKIAEMLRDSGSSAGCASVHCPFIASVASVIAKDPNFRIPTSLVEKVENLRGELRDRHSGAAACSSGAIPSSLWKNHVEALERSLAAGASHHEVRASSELVGRDIDAVLNSLATRPVGGPGAVISPHQGCTMEINGRSIAVDSECQVLLCRTYQNVQKASGVTRNIFGNGDDIVDNGDADEVEGDLYSVGISLQSLIQDTGSISSCSKNPQYSKIVKNLYAESTRLHELVRGRLVNMAKVVETVQVIYDQVIELMSPLVISHQKGMIHY